MHNSKQQRGKYALLVLNCLATALRLGLSLFTLALLFVLIVSVASRKINELPTIIGSPLHPDRLQGVLALLYLLFIAFSTLMEILRWVVRNWLARFPEHEKYLLTWKMLSVAKTRKTFIRGLWNVLQTIWFSFILAVLIPLTGQLLASTSDAAAHTIIIQYIAVVAGPRLIQLLALWAIILFIVITFLVRLLVHNQPKEENAISVKELEPVHRSLDAVAKHLQALSADFINRVMEDTDEHIIKGLAEKMLEPLEQKLEQEKNARLLLTDQLEQEKDTRLLLTQLLEQEKDARLLLVQQVQQLQTNPSSVPVPPAAQSQAIVQQKLNHS